MSTTSAGLINTPLATTKPVAKEVLLLPAGVANAICEAHTHPNKFLRVAVRLGYARKAVASLVAFLGEGFFCHRWVSVRIRSMEDTSTEPNRARLLPGYCLALPSSASYPPQSALPEAQKSLKHSKMTFAMATMTPSMIARTPLSVRPSSRPLRKTVPRANPFIGETNDPDRVRPIQE